MIYDSTITLAVKDTQRAAAAHVGRALDPDAGGDKSFDSIGATNAQGQAYLVTHTYCGHEFAAKAALLMSSAAGLKDVIDSDYGARWKDAGLTAPTLPQVTAFLGAGMLRVNMGLDQALQDMGLTRVVPT